MKSDLTAAMKRRETAVVTALRSVLAAVDNAEAVELYESFTPISGRTNDVPRKVLAENDIAQILEQEVNDRRSALAEYERLGKKEAAAQLRAEIAVIARYRSDATETS